MLAKDQRLSAKEIAVLPQDKKKNIRTENFNFVLFPAEKTKYAFLISSKLIKRAVDRNKLKRRITDLIKNDPRLLGLDSSILVIVKIDLTKTTNQEILNDLEKLL